MLKHNSNNKTKSTYRTYINKKNIIHPKMPFIIFPRITIAKSTNAIKEKTNATARCLPFNQSPIGDTCPVCGKKAHKVVLFAKAY